MGEPRAITYQDVEKSSGSGAGEVWKQIGEITGAGNVSLFNGNASIDLTDASDAKRAQIDGLLLKESASEGEKKRKEK